MKKRTVGIIETFQLARYTKTSRIASVLLVSCALKIIGAGPRKFVYLRSPSPDKTDSCIITQYLPGSPQSQIYL